jgi:4-amino-4-deoxy-L-arabinose transferase-like glycosyltransferase
MSRRLSPLALLLLLLWFLPLGAWRLFDPDEGRYAEISREMVATGDWVTPRLNAIKYFEKPPLQYWATAAAFEAFGVHDWTARLWTALSGALGVLLAVWLGARVYGGNAGLLAGLILAGSGYYYVLAHIATLDMGLSFALQLALSGLVLLVVGGRGAAAGDANAAARAARLAPWLLAAGVALAFLAKGLIGVLIPAAVAGLYLLLRRDWGLLLRSRPWWSLLALLVLAGPWVYAVSARNPEFLHFFFVHEHFQRFLTRVHDRYEPDWYFIPVLLIGFMPWTTLLPRVAAGAWRDARGGDGAAWMLALWAVFVFAFFSLSQSKLIPYIVPLFPALALLAGRAVDRMQTRRLALHLALATSAALLLLAALAWFAGTAAGARGVAQLGAAGTTGLFVSVVLGAAGYAAGTWLARRGERLAGVYAAAIATALTVTGLLCSSNAVERQRDQMAVIASLHGALKPGSEFYCVADYTQPVVYYLQRPCTIVQYQGELEFGLKQEPWRFVPDLAAFARRWGAATDPVALIRPAAHAELERMGVPMRVIYTSRPYVAVVRP